MFYLKAEISKLIKGECFDDEKTLSAYSRDASLFEVQPGLVIFPKDSLDIQKIVQFVALNKAKNPELSLTVRAAGSCMSGGSLNKSIILDVTKHMTELPKFEKNEAIVLPGTFYRDFEMETLKRDLILPCYTASKNLCAIGGMIGNNAGGEKTLAYGKMENYILETKAVLSDGNEYTIKPLNKKELNAKISQGDFEGNIYKRLFELITKNFGLITSSKPKVSKNSAGYYLWNIWDGKTFDLNKLIVGSQGTLCVVTEARLKLVSVKKKSKLLAVFLPNLNRLAEAINEILPLKPESLESYDDNTMKLAVRFIPRMLKTMKTKHFFKLVWNFLPEVLMLIVGGFPKLILLVEFSDDDETLIDQKMAELEERLKKFGFKMRATKTNEESEKYWIIRRESFNLLRKHVKGRRTAPFVDDVIVEPKYLPEFLPKMRKILDAHKLLYTIAGHAGNGNFHIIPLIEMKNKANPSMIREVSEQVYDVVLSYKGSITAEHNDGIVRTPYLEKMYGKEVCALFEKVKKIFDADNIFNPGKKVGGTIDYMIEHLIRD